jgi:hypothetical protein
MASRGVAAPQEVRDAVTKVINKMGVVEAARAFDMARETLMKVAAGVNVTPAILALVREKLRMLQRGER